MNGDRLQSNIYADCRTTQIKVRLKAVRSKTHALVVDIPNTVVVLEQTETHEVEPLGYIDERLAQLGLVPERAAAQLGAGYRQVKRALARDARESDVDDSREGGDEVARDTVSARLVDVWGNVGRDDAVDSLQIPVKINSSYRAQKHNIPPQSAL